MIEWMNEWMYECKELLPGIKSWIIKCCSFRLVLDWPNYNKNIMKLYTDHTGNMHDTIDAQQITAPIMDK